MLKLLQHWTAGPEVARVVLGDMPQAHQMLLYAQSQLALEEKKKLAKALAGIDKNQLLV